MTLSIKSINLFRILHIIWFVCVNYERNEKKKEKYSLEQEKKVRREKEAKKKQQLQQLPAKGKKR